jgi:uncharacterized lipoprotein YddW (UPF0748 family)
LKLARVCGAVIAVLLAVSAARPTHVLARDEVRALWVARTSLTSPQAVDDMVAAAQQSGFNTLLVQVRGYGDAYFLSGLEPRPASLISQPLFDPLAEAIAKAHAKGLAVHAWVNVNLVTGTDVPSSRAHIVYRHPEWLMVPRQLGEDLAALDPAGPEYLGRLTRYARARSAEIEGLYLSPATPAAVEYTAGIVRDIARRYAVDGVHFDYVRYPNEDFDYSREMLEAFHQSLAVNLPATDPFAYTKAFAERWRLFRAERLTALMRELHDAVKSARPAASVSVAVAPDPAEASAQRFQNWSRWLNDDLMDVACPMAYTTDAAAFVSQLANAQNAAGRHSIWAGIGAYHLSPEQTLDNIQAARRLGVSGLVLFSYDSLIAPSRGSGYLSQLGKAAFSAQF